jgi:hypothetical protein
MMMKAGCFSDVLVFHEAACRLQADDSHITALFDVPTAYAVAHLPGPRGNRRSSHLLPLLPHSPSSSLLFRRRSPSKFVVPDDESTI